MPRYEFKEGTSKKFWEIEIDGTSVTTRWGRIGTDGQSKTKELDDEAAAQKEYDKAVASKVKKGYQLAEGGEDAAPAPAAPSEPASEVAAAFFANPTDEAALVYADFLQNEGNPRGELIVLSRKAAQNPSDTSLADAVAAHVEKHKGQLLGDLTEYLESGEYDSKALTVTWRLGFFDSVKVCRPDYDSDVDAEELLKKVLEHPSAQIIRELRIGMVDWEGDNSYGGTNRVLAEHGPIPSLKKLFIGDFENPDETEMSWSSIGGTEQVWALYPNLEEMILKSGGMDIGKINAPRLKSLTVQTGGLDQKSIKQICAADLKSLERLEIWFGSSDYEASGSIDDIRPLLAGDKVPALRHLGLMNCEWADKICEELPGAKVTAQLETVDLSMGIMTDVGAKSLADNKDKLAHLQKLDVSDNYLSEDGVQLVQDVCREVLATSQKTEDNYGGETYRYVSVGE